MAGRVRYDACDSYGDRCLKVAFRDLEDGDLEGAGDEQGPEWRDGYVIYEGAFCHA